MKFQIFTVEGKGSFPVDILRYDACFPKTTEDALAITLDVRTLEELKAPRKVTLIMAVDSKDRVPTIGRWASFGWKVLDCTFRKV